MDPNFPSRDSTASDHLRREHARTRLLALSFDSPSSPSIRLSALTTPGQRDAPYGWGFAWYPKESPAALVVKDPSSVGENAMTSVLREWERFESTTFVCHLRGAARAIEEHDTHPFARAFGGRDWVFAHNGDLFGDLAAKLPLDPHPALWPLGRTDSEHAFLWLLSKVQSAGVSRLADVGWERLHAWLRELDALGTANVLLSDGVDLVGYHDDEGYNGLAAARLVPPHSNALLGEDVRVDLDDAAAKRRTMVALSTVPLDVNDSLGRSSQGPFVRLTPGQMVVVRRGAYVWTSHGSLDQLARGDHTVPQPPSSAHLPFDEPMPPVPHQRESSHDVRQSTHDLAALLEPQPAAARFLPDATPLPVPADLRRLPRSRVLSLVHETTYRYGRPVEHSRHVYRLRPVHDPVQELLAYDLSISGGDPRHEYEDVFGNGAVRTLVETPYDTMRITSRALVRIREVEHELRSPERRVALPLVWMPWQRQMMSPYLLPPELPETQLQELSEFAMSFVRRQDNDLVRMLLDLNGTIHRDFLYQSNSTTLETTPFDVYANRRGVCQDFANLFICLARLLSIPARYRVGYIYTGADHANTLQSEASHAWAEAYLPNVGWIGFDPTNGCLAGTDHIRVACGRNYRDATPTSGTIYKGGGAETLDVRVRVERVE